MLKFSNHVANNDQDQRKLSIISSGLLSFITNKPADNKHQAASTSRKRCARFNFFFLSQQEDGLHTAEEHFIILYPGGTVKS
jgi:hypothetical protein